MYTGLPEDVYHKTPSTFCRLSEVCPKIVAHRNCVYMYINISIYIYMYSYIY